MSHENPGKSNEWYTPKYVFDAMGVRFDLDVCSPEDRTHCHVPADEFLTINSAPREWWLEEKFVFMNPPFGNMREKYIWIDKFVVNFNGIALMPDRTSAPWWQYFARDADAVLFVAGKIKFINEHGQLGESPSNGTTLFAIGSKGVQALLTAQRNGLGKTYLR